VTRRLATLVALLALPGCIFLTVDNDDGVEGGYAPVIENTFPGDAGTQFVPTDSFASFSAAGTDIDSLYLEWEWQLDSELQALGSSDDGSFDAELEIGWSEDLSGSFSELRFSVSDQSYETEVFWSLSFE